MDKNEISFLMDKISNLYLKLFKEFTNKIKTEKIENRRTNEIGDYIDTLKIYIQDLIKLKQESIDKKIDKLINEFLNINLNLINIYATKAGKEKFKNILTEKSLDLLFRLYKYKEYLEKINKEEIDEQTKKQLSETIETILKALTKIIKNYYVNYIMVVNFKNITKSEAIFHLDLLNKIENDPHILLDEVDCPKINYAIEKFSKIK